MASSAGWGTSSPKEKEHEQDGSDRCGFCAGCGGGFDLFLDARRSISSGGLRRVPGKKPMPNSFGRQPGSRPSQRSIQRLRINRFRRDRDDAVRAHESKQRQMAANQVGGAKGEACTQKYCSASSGLASTACCQQLRASSSCPSAFRACPRFSSASPKSGFSSAARR